MANKPFYEMNPEELLPWLLNFITIARLRAAELPMVEKARLDALEDWMQMLQTKLNTQVAADEAKVAATRDLNDTHGLTQEKVSYFNTVIKADKSLPPELSEALGLPVTRETERPALATPLDLTVKPQIDGDHDLAFDRNGNPRGAVFVFESQTGDAAEWTYLDSTTERKYTHRGQKPGVQIAYRVKATYKGESSPWSAVAVAYFKG